MKTKRPNQCGLRELAIAACFSLVIAWQASAQPQVQQAHSAVTPIALAGAAAPAHGSEVRPAACKNACLGGSGGPSDRCGTACCGSCCAKTVCCPKCVTEEVKQHAWKVNAEMVCIPGFRFECNWRQRGQHQGRRDDSGSCCSNGSCRDGALPKWGRVRCVNVLEKLETTCDKCGYQWEVKCVRSGTGGCRRGGSRQRCPACGARGCGARGCCAATDTTAAEIQLRSPTREAKIGQAASETQQPSPFSVGRLIPWLK